MINELWNLEGKQAIVTGGTQGIGAAVTKLLLDLGANITIVARTKKDLDSSVAEYQKLNKKVYGVCSDLANKNASKIIYDEYRKNINDQKVDILINTIGVVLVNKFEAISHDEYEKNIQTNLGSTFEMCQTFFNLLKASHGATIVNISSINALRATPAKIMDGTPLFYSCLYK